MVTKQKISIAILPDVIKYSYEGDNDLLEKFHPFPGTLESCVESEMREMRLVTEKYPLEYYETFYFEEPIGYFAKADKFLHSFAVKKSFRKKDILIDWWAVVKNSFDREFIVMIYDSNTRVVEFLLKQGLSIIHKEPEKKMIIFKT